MTSPAVLAVTAAGKGFSLLLILYHASDNKKQSNEKQDHYHCRTHFKTPFHVELRSNESAENYLETILILSTKLPVVRSVDIANELGYKKSSISIAIKKHLSTRLNYFH